MDPAEDEVENGGVRPGGEGGGVAANGCANDGEDAGADDGADAEGGERDRTEGLFERVFGTL